MRIILRITIISILLLSTTYSVGWYFLLRMISNHINAEYANSHINLQSVMKESYFVRFSHISFGGFPFNLKLAINNFEEEGNSNKINYNAPIYLGYDLLKQRFFIHYKGETMALYKPLQSKFGSKIIADNYNFYINCPLTIKFIKWFFKEAKDSFELVNFLENLEYEGGKITIFDLVDDVKLYEQEYDNLNIKLEKSAYYLNIIDFLHHLPKRIDITSATKVTEVGNFDKKIAPMSILFGVKLPLKMTGSHKLYIKTTADNIKDVTNNLEIGSASDINSDKIDNINISLLYKRVSGDVSDNITFTIKSGFELKEGFIDDAYYLAKYLANIVNAHPLGKPMATELNYILDNKDKLTLQKLENKKYVVEGDLLITKYSDKLSMRINDLSIFANNTGFRLAGDHELQNVTAGLKNNQIKLDGDLILYNYKNLLDFLLNNFFVLSKYTELSEEQSILNSDVIKEFLKTISDHPETNSNDLSFKYDVDLQNIDNSKLGSSDFDQIKKLYRMALLKEVVKKASTAENFEEEIDKLVPNMTKDHKEFLKQLFNNPKQIDPALWEELINH